MKDAIVYDKVHTSIGIIFINKRNELLLLNHVKLGYWIIPVGKIDPGDSVQRTFEKEASEELGITNPKIHEIGVFKHKPKLHGGVYEVTMHIGFCSSYTGTIVNAEPNKHVALKWCNKDQIKDILDMTPNNAPVEWCYNNWDNILDNV